MSDSSDKNDHRLAMASPVMALVIAYIDLALELHDKQAINKDVLAARLRKSADRSDVEVGDATRAIVRNLALGLELASKEVEQ